MGSPKEHYWLIASLRCDICAGFCNYRCVVSQFAKLIYCWNHNIRYYIISCITFLSSIKNEQTVCFFLSFYQLYTHKAVDQIAAKSSGLLTLNNIHVWSVDSVGMHCSFLSICWCVWPLKLRLWFVVKSFQSDLPPPEWPYQLLTMTMRRRVMPSSLFRPLPFFILHSIQVFFNSHFVLTLHICILSNSSVLNIGLLSHTSCTGTSSGVITLVIIFSIPSLDFNGKSFNTNLSQFVQHIVNVFLD